MVSDLFVACLCENLLPFDESTRSTWSFWERLLLEQGVIVACDSLTPQGGATTVSLKQNSLEGRPYKWYSGCMWGL